MQFNPIDRSDRWKLKLFRKNKLKFGMWIDMHMSLNIDEHLTEHTLTAGVQIQ